ncbi:N-acetylglucosamine-6-phosphate deacetylase [Atopobacter sp. AH10]|uniref:N-acetylglucosamine-6-phosphate deacetylase n=1 Tax=Atopobacter sp. AH10 TaxID=2315861 RepID=UPI000EF214ED|nr:N-acetylglucosamine-6-phosphate deacetylase [Atopobacter sp. AH10]RLK62748.1 N-acetylglucosamine-6-phosphate deacetylase [Atopobacter sp. AH10]
MTTYIKAKRFYYPGHVREAGYLEITANGQFGEYTSELKDAEAKVVDYSDFSVAPGLVDTHIHGFMGYDVMDNDAEGLRVIAEGLPSCGVTSWLPTTLTADHDLLKEVCQTIKNFKGNAKSAKIRGIFFEGPYFCEEHKGAQNPKYMTDPNSDELDEWQEAAGGLLKKIAIAPERPGSVEFTRHAREKGIFIALGHSGATYEECLKAVDAGANIFVHVFNGMRGLHHREPGVVGAAMNCKETYGELICDGYHVQPGACECLMNAHGRDRIALITDCMRAGGLGDGKSTLGEFEVIVKDGAARLANSGSLAGSVLQLIHGVKNVVDWEIATPQEALHMATLSPAKSVKIDDVCGKIAAGYAADFIVLNDDLELQATYIDGEKVYQA